MILIVLLYAILASTFTIAKKAVAFGQPIFLIAVRMTVAGILLLGFHFLKTKKLKVIKKEDWWLFLKTMLFHIYIAFILEFWALQYITSAKTNLIYSATPFIVAFLAYFLLGERLTFRKKLGMAVGIIGLLPVLVLQANPEELHSFLELTLPEVALLISVTSAAYAWFLVKDLIKRDYGLALINGTSMLLGGLLAFITSLIVEVGFVALKGKPIQLVFDWPSFILWVGLLIVVANVIYYNFYGWLLRSYSITFLTFGGFLCPVFGAFFGWFFLGEHISWHYFLSLGIITLALFIYYREELRLKKIV